MAKCFFCGSDTNSASHIELWDSDVPICEICAPNKERKAVCKELLDRNGKILDFLKIDLPELSPMIWRDIFFFHLSLYQGQPNKRSLSILMKAVQWACGKCKNKPNLEIAEHFSQTLKGCHIGFAEELLRTDLPDQPCP